MIVIPFFNGSETEGRQKYKAFLDLSKVFSNHKLSFALFMFAVDPIDLTKEMPYEEMNSLQVCGLIKILLFNLDC